MWLVGHNIHVDWRLLTLPNLQPLGLLDTLRLARRMDSGQHALTALVHRLGLDDTMRRSAGASQPHRALRDAVATAYVLPQLIHRLWPERPATVETLHQAAGVRLVTLPARQPSLFE